MSIEIIHWTKWSAIRRLFFRESKVRQKWITSQFGWNLHIASTLLCHPKQKRLIWLLNRDVEKPSSTTLSIYAQPKTTLGALNSRFRQPEVCLGSQVFKIPMRPCEKKLKRITIQDAESNNQYQVLVVYGTFVSSRVMTLLDNKLIYEGFITVYTRGKLIPASSFIM